MPRKARSKEDAVFHAIADPTRRAMLDRLRASEASVGELGELFVISQPAVSQHLRVLREAKLVSLRKEGASRVYRLEARPLDVVDAWIAHYSAFWEAKLDALGTHLRRVHGKKSRL